MSRGVGKLQRGILEALERYPKGTLTFELCYILQPGGPCEEPVWDGSTSSAIRRALYKLCARGLVKICHESRRGFDSLVYGRVVSCRGNETLWAWLPTNPGPPIYPWNGPPFRNGHFMGAAQMLNPKRSIVPTKLNSKRCVEANRPDTQHL